MSNSDHEERINGIYRRLDRIDELITKLSQSIQDQRKGVEPEPVPRPTKERTGFNLEPSGKAYACALSETGKRADAQGNWFPTRQEALEAAKLRALTKRFRDAVAVENARTGFDLSKQGYKDNGFIFVKDGTDKPRPRHFSWDVAPESHYFAEESGNKLMEQFTSKELESIIRQVWVS